jgi:hypothetical protein
MKIPTDQGRYVGTTAIVCRTCSPYSRDQGNRFPSASMVARMLCLRGPQAIARRLATQAGPIEASSQQNMAIAENPRGSFGRRPENRTVGDCAWKAQPSSRMVCRHRRAAVLLWFMPLMRWLSSSYETEKTTSVFLLSVLRKRTGELSLAGLRWKWVVRPRGTAQGVLASGKAFVKPIRVV